MAGAAIVALALLNYFDVRRTSVYMVVGAVLWVAVLKSGVHATLAGVIIGFLFPGGKEGNRRRACWSMDCIPGSRLILPLFAFANAGVALDGVSASDIFSLLPLGIILGLFIGKPLGITLFCWLGIRPGIAKLPQGSSLRDIAAIGVLCGIGFTMSILSPRWPTAI